MIYKYAHDFALACDLCQCLRNIWQCNELPLTPILELELFDEWKIYFMGPFMSSYGMKYIVVVVDYASKWVESVALPNNEGRNIIEFLKKYIFSQFGTLCAIISDDGLHFCNCLFKSLL